MPLYLGRGQGAAEVAINRETCRACGLCVSVCKGAPLSLEDGVIQVDQTRIFGCIACGHCMAVCPTGSITVRGRDMAPEDLLPLPPREERSDFAHLHALMVARRSMREFTQAEVAEADIERILNAASTAPMGIPPSEVGVLVFRGRERVQEFRRDLTAAMANWRPLMSPLALALMRPFLGKDNYNGMKQFIGPTLDVYLDRGREDWFFYNAPLALYFYAPAFADAADPMVAATYAMLAGEALGLGTCFLGFPGYIMRYSKEVKRKYGLPIGAQQGLAVIFGHPAVKYRKALVRRLAEVVG